jgi:hypothetical protein
MGLIHLFFQLRHHHRFDYGQQFGHGERWHAERVTERQRRRHVPADHRAGQHTQPLYARTIPDRDRDEWVRLEIESNPLPICTRPQVLRSARRT